MHTMRTSEYRVLRVIVSDRKWRIFLKWLPTAETLPLIWSHQHWDGKKGDVISAAFLEWGKMHVYHKRDDPKSGQRGEKWLSKFLHIPVEKLNGCDGFLLECYGEKTDRAVLADALKRQYGVAHFVE